MDGVSDLELWNLYVPRWAPVTLRADPGDDANTCLELRDEELEHIDMLKEAMAKLPESASVETENDPDDAPYVWTLWRKPPNVPPAADPFDGGRRPRHGCADTSFEPSTGSANSPPVAARYPEKLDHPLNPSHGATSGYLHAARPGCDSGPAVRCSPTATHP